jgi:hypothetical protein
MLAPGLWRGGKAPRKEEVEVEYMVMNDLVRGKEGDEGETWQRTSCRRGYRRSRTNRLQSWSRTGCLLERMPVPSTRCCIQVVDQTIPMSGEVKVSAVY